MVTSNKLPDKKVVKMGDHNNSVVVPQRTLIGEVNEHITCPLCRGYYIDATTIVECLHSFCRSCIIKHLKAKSYCPVCEMMINSAKPNIKLDKALQDIVYKLVPGLFQKEMERRQQFYASRPGPAASATPEQRGEDTERIIFSPEDVISFSLEYADATDADSISSKSSDSNEPLSTPASTRRFLQCPAVVNISHLKKFLSMKFDIDSTQFAIDILYKRVPLPDYYTLMDIAYIYNWKRNEPMRFFYQIIDYVAIRNRIFDINRKSSFRENKASPALTDDTNDSGTAPVINDQASEASSGTDSPMPEDNKLKQSSDGNKKDKSEVKETSEKIPTDKSNSSSLKKNDDEVEKSQFLNSFELTPKGNCLNKTSPAKPNTDSSPATDTVAKEQSSSSKSEEKSDSLKRKYNNPPNTPELKKLKIEIEKTKISNILSNSGSPTTNSSVNSLPQLTKSTETPAKPKTPDIAKNVPNLNVVSTFASTSANTSITGKDPKPHPMANTQQISVENSGTKRPVMPSQSTTPKRKHSNEVQSNAQPTTVQKSVSPLKIHVPKMEPPPPATKQAEPPKPTVKKIPDLKPSIPGSQSLQSKNPPVNKVRMDLLANNSDPTIDRSKILSQVKTSLSSQGSPSPSGDPLKSLFDSCKINIPSSLSITLTDQKLDPRSPSEQITIDAKKHIVNKNLAGASNALAHKVPSPPVHNYIEILKLPDTDVKKPIKTDNGSDPKMMQNKSDSSSGQPKPNKSSETSAKGPIPNLKPIADTKLGKQTAANTSSAGPITFQQTFEQQLQTLQTDKKSKLPKNKAQVPKLVPATPKSFSAANKPGINKTNTQENKTGTALDLSSPHNVQSPSGVQQTFDKAFETMQSIANLAKKQSLTAKGMSPTMTQGSPSFNNMPNRPAMSAPTPLRIPNVSTNTMNQIKLDKILPSNTTMNSPRPDLLNKANLAKPGNCPSPTTSPVYQMSPHASVPSAQPSPRQTRSPSSSPKLVIAEEKQGNTPAEQNISQSSQITSSQINAPVPKPESPSAVPGPSKMGMKQMKPLTPLGKVPGRQAITPSMKPNTQPMNITPDYMRPQLMQQALMRQQIEMNAAWLKATQRQYEIDRFKMANMSNMSHPNQSDFNKDKQQ